MASPVVVHGPTGQPPTRPTQRWREQTASLTRAAHSGRHTACWSASTLPCNAAHHVEPATSHRLRRLPSSLPSSTTSKKSAYGSGLAVSTGPPPNTCKMGGGWPSAAWDPACLRRLACIRPAGPAASCRNWSSLPMDCCVTSALVPAPGRQCSGTRRLAETNPHTSKQPRWHRRRGADKQSSSRRPCQRVFVATVGRQHRQPQLL